MANLTLTIDDELLRSARLKAVAQGTSVNAVVRAYLETWVHADAAQPASVDAFLALGRAHAGRLTSFDRDELHER